MKRATRRDERRGHRAHGTEPAYGTHIDQREDAADGDDRSLAALPDPGATAHAALVERRRAGAVVPYAHRLRDETLFILAESIRNRLVPLSDMRGYDSLRARASAFDSRSTPAAQADARLQRGESGPC